MKIKYISILTLLITLIFSKSFSATSVYFIDLEYIINNSNYSNLIISRLNEEVNKKLKDLDNIEKNLIQQDQKLKQSKNVISNDEFNNKLRILSKNVDDFKNKKKLEIDNINKTKQIELNKIIQTINPLIEKYVNEKNIDILLNKKSVLISKNEFDETMNIINYINNKLK